MVGDGDFIDADTATGDLGGNLGFEAEAVFLDGDALDDLASKSFVAGLHVREVEVGEHVGEKGEEAVADRVPEIEDAMCLGSDETGAENDIGTVFENGPEHNGIFLGVVFEVGVLDNDDRRGGVADAGAESSALALVDIVAESPE